MTLFWERDKCNPGKMKIVLQYCKAKFICSILEIKVLFTDRASHMVHITKFENVINKQSNSLWQSVDHDFYLTW